MNHIQRAFRSLGLTCALLLLTLFSSMGSPALAATTQYNVPQLQTYVEAVDDMEQRQAIDPSLANQQREFYAQQASAIEKKPISVEALRKWNRFEGVFRVQTLFTIGAVILGIIGAFYFYGSEWSQGSGIHQQSPEIIRLTHSRRDLCTLSDSCTCLFFLCKL